MILDNHSNDAMRSFIAPTLKRARLTNKHMHKHQMKNGEKFYEFFRLRFVNEENRFFRIFKVNEIELNIHLISIIQKASLFSFVSMERSQYNEYINYVAPYITWHPWEYYSILNICRSTFFFFSWLSRQRANAHVCNIVFNSNQEAIFLFFICNSNDINSLWFVTHVW